MSREVYHNSLPAINTGTRSPGTRASRRLTELPTVDRSPSREYGSPLGKKKIINKKQSNLLLLLVTTP